MPLDPEAAAAIAMTKAQGVFGSSFDPIAFRAVFEAMVPMMWDASSIPLAVVEDTQYTGADGAMIDARFYVPHAEKRPLPVLLFFHGGGFCSGSVNTADPHCRYLAAKANVLVISASYRLAPEHKHPAGFLDCVAATEWAASTCKVLGGDPSRLAIGGDAPGGCYAAAVCHHVRDAGGPPLAAQFLLSPATDFAGRYPEKLANFEVGPVSAEAVAQLEDALFASAADRADWRISPLRANRFDGLPPAFILAGEYDFLTPEIKAYAAKLQAAGTPVTLQCWPGGMHNFFSMFDQIELARVAMRNAAHNLRLMLHESAEWRGQV